MPRRACRPQDQQCRYAACAGRWPPRSAEARWVMTVHENVLVPDPAPADHHRCRRAANHRSSPSHGPSSDPHVRKRSLPTRVIARRVDHDGGRVGTPPSTAWSDERPPCGRSDNHPRVSGLVGAGSRRRSSSCPVDMPTEPTSRTRRWVAEADGHRNYAALHAKGVKTLVLGAGRPGRIQAALPQQHLHELLNPVSDRPGHVRNVAKTGDVVL